MSEQNKRNASSDFVICDVRKEYAEHLFQALSGEYGGRYRFHLFHTADGAEKFLRSSGAEILLVGEELEEEIRKENAGSVFILTGDPDKAGEGEQGVFLFRYQSSDSMIRRIRKGRKTEKSVRKSVRDTAEGPVIRDPDQVRGLIGIYSPVHRIGKTRFAIRLGRQLAEKIPVLYVNMEGYSGENYYFRDAPDKDLGDLIYSMKQQWGDSGVRISSMAGRCGKLDYIRPMGMEQDLRSVREEEWIRLIDLIFEKCIYRAVILDLGDSVNGLYGILEKCSRIYTLYNSEKISAAKLEQYEKNLTDAGYADVLSRTIKRQVRKVRSGSERAEDAKNEQNRFIV